MLTRIDSFFGFFDLDEKQIELSKCATSAASRDASGMTDVKDYEALAAIALHYQPRNIFEIGTYRGITSNFFLELLPGCCVVSIAYQNPRRSFWRRIKRSYNNSQLLRDEIGSGVEPEKRSRFTQLYGDSHKLNYRRIVRKYGPFDLVFIDGDHSRNGVAKDTKLAKKIIHQSGVICWHDANPKGKYIDVRQFLENELVLTAVATKDTYVGGIACWSTEIEKRINLVECSE